MIHKLIMFSSRYSIKSTGSADYYLSPIAMNFIDTVKQKINKLLNPKFKLYRSYPIQMQKAFNS